jgi:hypothetical protein
MGIPTIPAAYNGDFNGSKPHAIRAAEPYVGFPAMTIPELEEKLAVDSTPLVAFR